MKHLKYTYRTKHCKIIIDVLEETTFIGVYNKYGCWLSSISENNNPKEIKEDINDALSILKNKSSKKWFKKVIQKYIAHTTTQNY